MTAPIDPAGREAEQKSMHRLKVALAVSVVVGLVLGLLGVPLTWATFGVVIACLLPIASWAIWPVNAWHLLQWQRTKGGAS